MSETESNSLVLDPREEDSEKVIKLSINKRYLIKYRKADLLFTLKQMEVISLISKGFSNLKIAKQIGIRESTIKLMVYRLMRYLEDALGEKVDRFYLIILSQEVVKIRSELNITLDSESIPLD
jgi:DNA-binding CsgD family transcriptional regulator